MFITRIRQIVKFLRVSEYKNNVMLINDTLKTISETLNLIIFSNCSKETLKSSLSKVC